MIPDMADMPSVHVMNRICNAVALMPSCIVAPSQTRVLSQYPRLVNLLLYGSNKQVWALSHSDKLKLLFILLVEG